MGANPYLPRVAEIVARTEEAPDIFTLRLRFAQDGFAFAPGQFNMLYLPGVGEVAISIASDPADARTLDHTIRAVGRVTKGLARLRPGDKLGVRGPYGRGWPVMKAKGKGLLMVTGGLGCAPATSAIQYAMERRDDYGPIAIAHGVKKGSDLIYSARFQSWEQAPRTKVLLSANEADPGWRGKVGLVTDLLGEVDAEVLRGVVMMCGPEQMMRAVGEALLQRGVSPHDIYVAMERNMQCGLGHCGNCQLGKYFICKDGPVFSYHALRDLLAVKGF